MGVDCPTIRQQGSDRPPSQLDACTGQSYLSPLPLFSSLCLLDAGGYLGRCPKHLQLWCCIPTAAHISPAAHTHLNPALCPHLKHGKKTAACRPRQRRTNSGHASEYSGISQRCKKPLRVTGSCARQRSRK